MSTATPATLKEAIATFNETLPLVAKSYAMLNALGTLVSIDLEGNILRCYLSDADKEYLERNGEHINDKLKDEKGRVEDVRNRHVKSASIIVAYYMENDPHSKDLLNEAYPNRKCHLPDGHEESLPGSDDLEGHVRRYTDPSLENEMQVEVEPIERCYREVITRHRDNLLALREIHLDVCQLVNSFPLLVQRLRGHLIETFREAVQENEESIGAD